MRGEGVAAEGIELGDEWDDSEGVGDLSNLVKGRLCSWLTAEIYPSGILVYAGK